MKFGETSRTPTDEQYLRTHKSTWSSFPSPSAGTKNHWKKLDTIEQACTLHGPRVIFGPRTLLNWPAKPEISALRVFLINAVFEWVKSNHFGPWVWPKKYFTRIYLSASDWTSWPFAQDIFARNWTRLKAAPFFGLRFGIVDLASSKEKRGF